MFVVYEDYNSTKIDPYNDIVWSDAFAEIRLIPQSDYVIRNEIRTLNSGVVTAMSLTSICFSFICAVLIIKYRQNEAMKSVSWKINITSVFGGVLLLLSIFLLGIDANKTFMRADKSRYSENNGRNYDFLCNVCAWLLLSLFMVAVSPMKHLYKHEGNLETVDDLISNQFEYGMCSMGKKNSQYGVTLWKAIELFFGGYAAMNVSQILCFRQIARFDET